MTPDRHAQAPTYENCSWWSHRQNASETKVTLMKWTKCALNIFESIFDRFSDFSPTLMSLSDSWIWLLIVRF